jgi:hypothetical protein
VEHNNVIQFGQVQALFLNASVNNQSHEPPKNLVDLSDTSYSSSPFEPSKPTMISKNRPNRARMVLQLVVLVGGIIATAIFLVLILKMLKF